MSPKSIVTLIIGLAIVGTGAYFLFMTEDNNTETPQNNTTNNSNHQNNTPTPTPNPTPTPTTDSTQTINSAVVKFETTEGSFEVTLDGKAAPLTVKNFVKKVEDGYYNGKKFYRVENSDPSFRLIQGGDPENTSTITIPAEIGLKHTKGAIAMARTDNPAKASSETEFYITVGDVPVLDGGYTVFGYVSLGMNAVEKLGSTPTEPYMGISLPLKELVINKVTVKEKK